MTSQPLHPDDPRLTAYVLGELDADEQAAVEREIDAHPRLRAALDEIRAAAGLVADALAREPLPAGGRVVLPARAVAATPRWWSRIAPVVAALALTLLAAAGAALSLPSGDPASTAGNGDRDSDGVILAYRLEDQLSELEDPLNGRWDEHERVRSFAEGEGLIAQDNSEILRPNLAKAGKDLPTITINGNDIVGEFGDGPDVTLNMPAQTPSDPYGVTTAQPDDARAMLGAGGASAAFGGQPRRSGINDNGVTTTSGDGVAATGPPGGGYGGYRFKVAQDAAPATSTHFYNDFSVSGIRSSLRGDAAEGVVDHLPKLAEWKSLYAAENGDGTIEKYGRGYALGRGLATEGRALDVTFEQGWFDAPLPQADAGAFMLVTRDGELGGGEAYAPIVENAFITPTGQNALSTFSVDVDTASFSNVRRFLKSGQFPPPDAVRVEELVNYFHYDYPAPADGTPFSVTTEVGPAPWQPAHRLIRIGLKGREIAKEKRPVSNLVFLLDVSGSMQDANKLPLLKQSIELLVGEMNENDRVAIVTYSDTAQLALGSTSGEDKGRILDVVHGLVANGSTNGAGGIQMAYEEALKHFTPHGTNRVILCTDGDFNVGIGDTNELAKMVQEKAKANNIFLSVFGFGMGNIKDEKLEALADRGNGHYAYVDDLREARKVFVEELTGTLYTIAKDVKLQVEFNPAHAGAYRLIGYENRVLAAQDFKDDAKDAGEIGAGHTVTALYEVIPVAMVAQGKVDPLKYQKAAGVRSQESETEDGAASRELLTVKLRYKLPDSDTSTPLEVALVDDPQKNAPPSRDFEWAAAVAAFGMILRDSSYKGQADFTLVRELALGSRGDDKDGRRREFIDLLYTAHVLKARREGNPLPEPQALPAEEAQTRAAVGDKYRNLLKTVEVPADAGTFGPFHDFGYWAGTSYAGQDDLPQGHWVYVYPNWYIWGELSQANPPQNATP